MFTPPSKTTQYRAAFAVTLGLSILSGGRASALLENGPAFQAPAVREAGTPTAATDAETQTVTVSSNVESRRSADESEREPAATLDPFPAVSSHLPERSSYVVAPESTFPENEPIIAHANPKDEQIIAHANVDSLDPGGEPAAMSSPPEPLAVSAETAVESEGSFDALQPFCGPQPLLLQVRVAGSERGAQFAYSTSEGVWLAEQALTASEAAYGSKRDVCDGVTYVLLRPEVVARLDTLTLSLDIDANFALLSSRRATIVPRVQSYATDLSLTRLRYNLSATATPMMSAANALGEVGVDYLRGAFRLQATYIQGFGSNADFDRSINGSADVQLADTASIGVFAQSSDVTTGFGVRGNFSTVPERIIAPIELRLPVDTDVEVVVDNQTIDTVRALAGTFVVDNLRPKATSGTVVLRWREGNSVRTLVTPYDYRAPFDANSFGIQGSLGYDARIGAVGQADMSFAPTSNVQLAASVTASTASGSAGIAGTLVQQKTSYTVRADTSWGSPSATTSVTGRVGMDFGDVGVNVTGTYAFPRPEKSFLGVDASYNIGSVGLNAVISYRFDQALTARVTSAWRPSTDTSLGAFAEFGGGRTRVGLQGRMTLRPTSNSTLGVTASSATGASGLFGLPVQGAVDYTLRPNATDALSVTYLAPTLAAATYSFNRVVSGSVSADTNGTLRGNVRGGFAFVGGQASVTTENSGSALLLRTGIANINIYSGGRRVGTTDAAGNVVITGLSSTGSAQVSVSLDDLPIEISVRSPSLSLVLNREGVYSYDWTSNFQRSRFVQLRWNATQVASFGVLDLPGGQTLYADRDGQVLIPALTEPLRGLLREEDGSRRCNVVIELTGDVTCAD